MVSSNSIRAALLLALAIWASCPVANSQDFKNPVRSAAEDEIQSLPGLNFTPTFKHYSGYLKADDQTPTNRFWHYWFVESRSNPDKDPLVLWLNGGPGCSSLLGLLTELGPLQINADGQVVNNPYAWNDRANVLFMESPAGVGFSYAVNGDIKADDDSTAKQNHLALRSFLEKFPQFKDRPLYLTGESYGGVYLPTLASLVDDDKTMNLKGVAIGNGYLDEKKLAESLIYFSYYHGLIGRTSWKGLSAHCCNGKPPARGQCKFTDSSVSEKCTEILEEITNVILNSGLNPYNLYDKCAHSPHSPSGQLQSQARFVGRSTFDKSLLLSAFNKTRGLRNGRHSRVNPKKFEVLRGDPPCTDDSIVIDYLNRPETKAALHIPAGLNQTFTTCFDGIQYTMIYPGSKDGMAPQLRKLISSPRDLTLLVYNGDVDMMCNFFGDEWFVDDLNRDVIADYQPWHVDGQVAGFVKHYDRITYMTVRGSGHMVPTDKPAEALHMFNIFLYGHKKAINE